MDYFFAIGYFDDNKEKTTSFCHERTPTCLTEEDFLKICKLNHFKPLGLIDKKFLDVAFPELNEREMGFELKRMISNYQSLKRLIGYLGRYLESI